MPRPTDRTLIGVRTLVCPVAPKANDFLSNVSMVRWFYREFVIVAEDQPV